MDRNGKRKEGARIKITITVADGFFRRDIEAHFQEFFERVIADIAYDLNGEPTVDVQLSDVEPVRHGRWIECDYKKLEHGFLETYPKAGLCCSVCRTGFEKKKMTYKQHCPHCGAKMDEEE